MKLIYNLHNLSSVLLSRLLKNVYDSTKNCLEANNVVYSV
jgi:hypothetical protein